MKRRFAVLIGMAAFWLPLSGLASPPPVTDAVTVQASVCAPGSVTPAITSPVNGATVSDALLTVSGTATANQTVTVYRNAVVAGTTIADALGGFTLSITLNTGNNVLTALSCTTSPVVNVTYTPPTPPPTPRPRPTPPHGSGSGSGSGAGTNSAGNNGARGDTATETSNGDRQGSSEVVIDPNPQPPGQPAPAGTFYLLVSPDILEGSVGQLMELPFAIFGGTGPFTIRTLAGDGSELTVVATDRSLLFRHTYGLTGQFPVTIEVTDASGRRAIIQSVIRITSGSTGAMTKQPSGGDHSRRALGLIFSLELLGLAGLFAVWEYYLRNRPHAKS